VIALVEAQLALGRLGEARRHHREHVERLGERLGIEPTSRLRLLAARLEDDAAAVAAPRPIPPPQALRMRAPLAPLEPDLIGRRSELQMLERLLAQADCRVLTITGPGGIGKARVALQRLAATKACAGVRRVWVALEDLGDIESGLARLAAALGIELGRGGFDERLAALVELPRRRPVLIVFDNAEHLSDMPALARRLADADSQTTLIVTSRTRPAIEASGCCRWKACRFPTPTRPRPKRSPRSTPCACSSNARAKLPRFAAAPHAVQIAALVRAVEGLPLAIELAAAWVRLLPVAQIAAEIRGSLDLLERAESVPTEGRGHRSVRAAFETSWALLAPREREVLAALSVLRAPFSRLAALGVAGASLAELASLADRSLVRGGDEGRFSMHPLMNRFAAEKLGERPEAERRALDAHAEYFLRALAVHEAWHAIDQKAAIDQLTLELPDALAALRRALASGRARQALAAIGVIARRPRWRGRCCTTAPGGSSRALVTRGWRPNAPATASTWCCSCTTSRWSSRNAASPTALSRCTSARWPRPVRSATAGAPWRC
jgi:predicted ATPase